MAITSQRISRDGGEIPSQGKLWSARVLRDCPPPGPWLCPACCLLLVSCCLAGFFCGTGSSLCLLCCPVLAALLLLPWHLLLLTLGLCCPCLCLAPSCCPLSLLPVVLPWLCPCCPLFGFLPAPLLLGLPSCLWSTLTVLAPLPAACLCFSFSLCPGLLHCLLLPSAPPLLLLLCPALLLVCCSPVVHCVSSCVFSGMVLSAPCCSFPVCAACAPCLASPLPFCCPLACLPVYLVCCPAPELCCCFLVAPSLPPVSPPCVGAGCAWSSSLACLTPCPWLSGSHAHCPHCCAVPLPAPLP
jgi:hypothetical protein